MAPDNNSRKRKTYMLATAGILALAVLAGGIWGLLLIKNSLAYWDGIPMGGQPDYSGKPVIQVVKNEYQSPRDPDKGNISKTAHEEFANCGGDEQIKQILLDDIKNNMSAIDAKKMIFTPQGKSYSYSVENVGGFYYEIHCLGGNTT